jgi:hypothetical protein
MRLPPREFRALTLRVHDVLHDVPLEDAWVMRLPGGGPGRGMQELAALFSAAAGSAPRAVQWLFRLRWRLGRWFGWDAPRPAWAAETFADRLSPGDRARSEAAPGTPDGRLKLLYRFDDEQLSELRNGTVHAFLSLSLRPAPEGYLGYLAVYVRPVQRFTRLYMAAIAPFRRLVVYPAIVRGVERAWAERFGPGVPQPTVPPG